MSTRASSPTPTFHCQGDRLCAIDEIADRHAFVGLMRLRRIARAEIHRWRPSKSAGEADVAMGAEPRQNRRQIRARDRVLEGADERMIGGDFGAIGIEYPFDLRRAAPKIGI